MPGERTVSSVVPRFHAASIPRKQPRTKLIPTATPPSIIDHPISCPMMVMTGVGKYWIEFPKLPCSRLPRYLKYCSHNGSCVFRPNCAERACCISGVTYPCVDILPTSSAKGSPGAWRGMKKSMVIATHTAKTKCGGLHDAHDCSFLLLPWIVTPSHWTLNSDGNRKGIS